MQDPAFNAGGYNWYEQGSTVNPNLPIVRPAHYTGLLGKQKTADALKNFAGGLLSQGYQYDPSGNAPHMFKGILSSGQQSPGPTDGQFMPLPRTASPQTQPQTAPTGFAGQPMDNQYVNAVDPSGIYNPGEVGTDVTTGNNGAGELTVRNAMDNAIQANTPWKVRPYRGDTMYGNQINHMIGDPNGERTTRAQESFERRWSNSGFSPEILNETYDPTNEQQANFIKFALDDQQREIAALQMDSGIYGHGGGDGGGDGGAR